MVVVGVHMATKVGGVNMGLVGVRAGVVQDFQEDPLGAMGVKGIQVVLADMGNSHMKTTSVVLSNKVTEEVKEMEECHLPLVKK